MRIAFLPILLLFFISSCNTETPQKVSASNESLARAIVCPQQFETALFDLKMDEDSLQAKGIKSYTSTQIFATGKPSRTYYYSFDIHKGNLSHADIIGKDTIISERILNMQQGVKTSLKKWHQINRVVKVIEYNKNGYEYRVENEKGKNDSIRIKKNNKHISVIDYISRNENEIHVFFKKDKEKVSYIEKVKDTLYQFENTWLDGHIISTRYLKDLHHMYTYMYATNGALDEIVWKENSKKG